MSEINTFEVSCEITRAANTTQYTAGDYVNSLAVATLPTLDFSPLCTPCQAVQITSAAIVSDYGGASTKLSASVYLFNVNNPQTSCADNTAVAVPYATVAGSLSAVLEDVSYAASMGSTAYAIMQNDMSRIAVLSDTAKLYPAIVATNAYTPKSGEKITLKLKGFVL